MNIIRKALTTELVQALNQAGLDKDSISLVIVSLVRFGILSPAVPTWQVRSARERVRAGEMSSPGMMQPGEEIGQLIHAALSQVDFEGKNFSPAASIERKRNPGAFERSALQRHSEAVEDAIETGMHPASDQPGEEEAEWRRRNDIEPDQSEYEGS